MRGPACSSFPIILLMRNEGPFVAELFCAGVSGRYPSGQRGQTVNLLPSASKVRILACPPEQADTDGSAECWARSTTSSGFHAQHHVVDQGGRSSAVESQPSKLAVVGSTPTARSNAVHDAGRETVKREQDCQSEPTTYRKLTDDARQPHGPRSSVGRARPW